MFLVVDGVVSVHSICDHCNEEQPAMYGYNP